METLGTGVPPSRGNRAVMFSCCSRQELRGSLAPSGNAGVASRKAEIPKPARTDGEAEAGGASGFPLNLSHGSRSAGGGGAK